MGAKHLRFMNQIHGKDILVVRQDTPISVKKTTNVDAMITHLPDLALMVKQADCQGIIVFDPI